MKKLSIPITIHSPTYNREAVLADCRLCGADTVLLSPPTHRESPDRARKWFDLLKRDVPFYRENGLKVGVWIWTFWVEDVADMTPFVGFFGKKAAIERCPLDENLKKFIGEVLSRIAESHPDLILFDDDWRTAYQDSGFGCICPLHRKLTERFLGEKLPEDKELFPLVFGGKPNKYRRAYLDAMGKSMDDFAIAARAAVDSVSPETRIGHCACIGTFDLDGTDSYRLAKLLAGEHTKPFLRLIGAPYWHYTKTYDLNLVGVIEQERLLRSWREDDEVEVYAEGDVYPRPRYSVPAAYLELFDTALMASGGFAGIMKYMFDYASSAKYERGYINAHLRNAPQREFIEKYFSDKDAVGVRVWEPMKTIADADYSDREPDEDLIVHQFGSPAASMLGDLSVETTYTGAGRIGIAFGEAARHLPPEAFDSPLVLDLPAARILSEKGIDVGLDRVGDFVLPYFEKRLSDGEFVPLQKSTGLGGKRYAREVSVRAGAKILTEWKTSAGATDVNPEFTEDRGGGAVGSYRYRNADGKEFLVFCFDGDRANANVTRNYVRQAQIFDFAEETGRRLPVRCDGNPYLYCMVKDSDDGSERAIGFWNCSADLVDLTSVTVDGAWTVADAFGCTADATGKDGLTALDLGLLPAFSSFEVVVKKK